MRLYNTLTDAYNDAGQRGLLRKSTAPAKLVDLRKRNFVEGSGLTPMKKARVPKSAQVHISV